MFHRKKPYHEPVQLNMQCLNNPEDQAEGYEEPRPLTQCIVDMESQSDFCIFLTEDGVLHSMGTNLRGLLGLGRVLINTGGNSHPIRFPKNEKIIDFKVGKSHALALTEDGKVYGWGNNSDG